MHKESTENHANIGGWRKTGPLFRKFVFAFRAAQSLVFTQKKSAGGSRYSETAGIT